MRNPLKHWFVPHPGNGHYPRFWGRASLAAVVALALLAGAARFAIPALFKEGSFLASILPAVIVSLTNDERVALAEPALARNELLDEAARLKAEDMAARGYFAHVSPEGWQPWHWLDEVGYGYEHAGENLAVNFDDSDEVVEAWMNSPTHRANIVKAKYTEIGVGLAKGRFNGRPAIYVVQYFGTPKGAAAPVQLAPAGAEPVRLAPAPAEPTPTSDEVAVAPAPVREVAGAEVNAERDVATAFVASPRSVGTYVLWGILALVTVAFALAVFVAVRIQFRAILVGGTVLILALAGLLWFEHRGDVASRLLGDQPATSTESR